MKTILIALLALPLLAACGKDKSKQADSKPPVEEASTMAVAYYRMLADGNVAGYVKAMQSCDNTTASYKQRMEATLKHHRKEIEKDKKGVKQVKALRYELHDNDRMANVFLRVTYNDGSEEEILFPVVYDGKRWRIQ